MPTTAEAISLPFEEAIGFFRQKARIPTAHWTDVWRTGHSRGFMVAGAATDALLEDFQGALKKALGSGTTLGEFRKDFDAIVTKHGWAYNGTPGWRSRIIYETNLSTAYSAGRYAQLTEPETLAAFPYWQYVHSGSRHPRLQHLAWNGLVLRADDPFWSSHYPPNGWRCGCRVAPVSGRGLARMGKTAPDPSPPIETRPWRNPRTGEVHQVPVGIDPGFDYNPGLAWKQGAQALPTAAADIPRPPTAAPPSTPPAPAPLPPAPKPTPKPKPPPFDHAAIDALPARLGGLPEADDVMRDAYRPWANSLRHVEIMDIANYRGSGYNAINKVLREGLQIPEVLHEAERLAGAISLGVAPVDMRLFRGINGGYAETIGKLRAGQTFTDRGFVSMSLDQPTARGFGADGIMLEIVVPKGYKGVSYIHNIPVVSHNEYEMLMNRGTRFRVLSKSKHRLVVTPVPPLVRK